jgi:hypothetical protein
MPILRLDPISGYLRTNASKDSILQQLLIVFSLPFQGYSRFSQLPSCIVVVGHYGHLVQRDVDLCGAGHHPRLLLQPEGAPRAHGKRRAMAAVAVVVVKLAEDKAAVGEELVAAQDELGTGANLASWKIMKS